MHSVIIGNGISGVTAARWLRKLSENKITIISSESKYFFSRTALMYIYMGHMREVDTQPYEPWFWKKNRIDLKQDHVNSIDFKNKQLDCSSGDSIQYDQLILALGSKSNKFGWPGQDLKAVGGLYHLQDLQNMEKYSKNLKRAVVVGGGLIGIEMAEMFHSRNIPVTMLVRENSYWDNALPKEESEMVTRHIMHHNIDLRLNCNLGEILDDGNGKAKAATIKETGEIIECGYVGLTAGVSPNISWLKETELETNRGILVNENLQTNIPDVYAIGDCAELKNPKDGRRGVEAIWYTGRMMGETVAYNVTGKNISYDPGLWFNSAKFLDIEYQVYGEMPSRPAEHHSNIYWEHEDGEKSIRIVYDKNDQRVLGFNLMGIRFRHEVCEKWILDKANLDLVLQNLSLANFDPEFCKQYEGDLLSQYNKQTGKNLSLKKERKLDQVLSFLNFRK